MRWWNGDGHMYRAWVDLPPGFHWLSSGSFLLGLVETVGHGFFFGLIAAGEKPAAAPANKGEARP